MKKVYSILSVLTLFALIYLLWPLDSDKYRIDLNLAGIEMKTHFLKPPVEKQAVESPNILLIVVDDLGMSDLSLYGDGYPETPAIDRLGHSGVVFNNAYVTSPVCSPSRAAILSGRYQQRFGFQYQLHERYLRNRMEYFGFRYFVDAYPWVPKWMNEVPNKQAILSQGMPPSEILLPGLLKKHGYETALIGKWHLGADSLRNPCQFGFDFQFGFYASHSLYARENSPGIHDQKVAKDFTDAHIWSGQRMGPHAIYENCNEIEVDEYLTDRFADEAIKYMEADRKNPFFLYLSFNAPHTPLQAPLTDMEKFQHVEDPIKRTYYAMIANLDNNIDRVLRSLEKSATLENTLIFFISDNGGAAYTYTTDNGRYKGGKITNLEGGLKVPFIVSWKNVIDPGIFNKMVSSMDIFQTIIEVTKVHLPADRKYDGVNLLPFLTDKNAGSPHDFLYWQRGFSKAIRSNRWKLCINEEAGDTVLFDMTNDPFEGNDIFASNRQVGNDLAITHDRWSENLPEPLWPSMIYYMFVDGDKNYYFDQ
jgi:arylsulfatase A-like enzyme